MCVRLSVTLAVATCIEKKLQLHTIKYEMYRYELFVREGLQYSFEAKNDSNEDCK